MSLLDYRLADKAGKPMGKDELATFLTQPHIMRIAFVDERDNYPVVHPVWYYYEDDKFFVAIDSDGQKAKSLRKNPALYFLIDSDPPNGPPLGVRGKAKADVVDDPDYATKVTVRNILRYLGSLEGNAAKKIKETGRKSSVLEINPLYLATWKF